jgi:hypothetical protein
MAVRRPLRLQALRQARRKVDGVTGGFSQPKYVSNELIRSGLCFSMLAGR